MFAPSDVVDMSIGAGYYRWFTCYKYTREQEFYL